MTPDDLKMLVRSVPDFPPRHPVSRHHHADRPWRRLAACVDHLADRARAADAELIAGMEARGFIFGAAVAARMGVGFLPVRKPGKLPVKTIGIDYALEYGRDRLEIDPRPSAKASAWSSWTI
jgi:adenine phosphoribosyltransferase